MSGLTSKLGLYLPGGGSTGAYGADEVADIDKLNSNFQKIDDAFAAVGSTNYSIFSYRNGTDQNLGGQTYTNIIFDTIEYDGLGLDYLGVSTGTPRSSFKVTKAGRYEFQFRFMPAYQSNSPNYLISTVFNETQGQDNQHFHGYGIQNDVPVFSVQMNRFNANDTFRAAIFKSDAGTGYIRRGDTSSNAYRDGCPQLRIKYLGPT